MLNEAQSSMLDKEGRAPSDPHTGLCDALGGVADDGGRGAAPNRFSGIVRTDGAGELGAQRAASAPAPTPTAVLLQCAHWPPIQPGQDAFTRETETAMTRCLSADTTGSAMVADPNAIRASMCKSSPVTPTTDGINVARLGRPVSEVRSLTCCAIAASRGCVHTG